MSVLSSCHKSAEMRDNVTVSNLALATRSQPEIHNRPLACSDMVSAPRGSSGDLAMMFAPLSSPPQTDMCPCGGNMLVGVITSVLHDGAPGRMFLRAQLSQQHVM